MKNIHLYKMKVELKDLTNRIRNGKTGRKPSLRIESNYSDWKSLEANRWHFRHLHIAYCIIRGRSRDQIEQPSEFNLPSESYITRFLDAYYEAVRSSEKGLTA